MAALHGYAQNEILGQNDPSARVYGEYAQALPRSIGNAVHSGKQKRRTDADPFIPVYV